MQTRGSYQVEGEESGKRGVSADRRAEREKRDLNLFEQSGFDLGHKRGDREVMQNGKRGKSEGGTDKRQMDGHSEKSETDNSHKGLFRRNLVDRCLCV